MKGRKLREALLRVFVLVSVLPVAILGMYVISQSGTPTNSEIRRELEKGVETGIRYFDDMISTYDARLTSLADNESVRALLTGGQTDRKELYRALYDVNTGFSDNAIVCITDADQNILETVGLLEREYPQTVRQHGIVLSIMHLGKRDGTGFYPCNYTLSNGSDVVLSAVREIREKDKVIGYLFMDIPEETLSGTLSQASAVQIGNSTVNVNFLVYNWYNRLLFNDAFSGNMAVGGVSDQHVLTLDFRDAFKTDKLYSQIYTQNKTDYQLSGKKDRTGDFIIVGSVPVALAKEKSQSILASMIILALIAFLASLLISLIMTRRLTKPVGDLLEAMKQVEKGNLDTQVSSDSYAEIRELQVRFNAMTAQLQTLFRENEEKQQLIYEAERNSLLSQIQPHFLNNVLESIRYLIRLGKTQDAEKMIEDLGTIIERYIRNTTPFERVSKIMAFVDAYLSIQKTCYADDIRIERDIAEDIEDEIIPTFLLQPLVENAIVHGLLRKPGGGTLRIEGRRSGSDLIFTVEDDGTGMTEEARRELYQRSSGEHGNGFYNVDRRIKLFCGEEYGLTVVTVPGKGTKIQARIKGGLAG